MPLLVVSRYATGRWKKPETIVFFWVGLVVLTISSVLIVSHFLPPAASREFTRGYTAAGGCLHQTVYDPANGAVIHEDTVSGNTVVTVIPAQTGAKTAYPTLSFDAQYQSGRWTLRPISGTDFESVISSPLCVNNPTLNH